MPEDSWMSFSSSRLPYQIAVPDGWTLQEPVESLKDELWGDDNLLAIEITTNVAEITSAEWQDLAEANLRSMGFKVRSAEPTVVAGMRARIFQVRLDRFLKKAIHVLRASFHDGTYGWEMTLSVGDGAVEPDPALFSRILASFERLEIVLAADDTSGNVWALHPGDCFAALPFQFNKDELTVFMGGVDGFRRVACSEPHTGEVAMVLKADEDPPGPIEEIFEAYVGEPLAKSDFGIVVMNPLPQVETVPTGVEGVFVIAHPAGQMSGPARRSTDSSTSSP